MILFSLTNDNCYPISLKSVKERPAMLDEITKDLLGSRLSGDKVILPMLKDEIEAVHFGDKWNKNADMERALAVYQKLLESKVKKAFKFNQENFTGLARELKLIKIALMVIRADKPSGARFAWAESKTDWPYKPLLYAAIFLASAISIRCCIPPVKDEGRETRIIPDEKGEHDVAWKWELNGITFVYFPRNSNLLIEQDGKMRKPTQAEQEMFHQARLNLGGARLATPITNVVAVGVGNGMNLPFLKSYLEKRGFGNVVIQAIDDGWWMVDKGLPMPTTEMRQEIVELSDRTLIGRLASDEYRIRYVDLFDKAPQEFLGKFDIAFLTPNKEGIATSYVEETLKLINDFGILVIRLRNGQDLSRDVLEDFCKANSLSLSIYKENIFPNPDQEFQDLMIVVQKARFADKKGWVKAKEIFRRLIGSRLSVEVST